MVMWVREIGYQPADFDRFNIVHVAGTKGKGTTCAFVDSILSQYHDHYKTPRRVGLYTSPHLLSVCERIRINSKPLTEEKFAHYFFEVWDMLEAAAVERGGDISIKPKYFRYLTLMSFHVFMKEDVDVAIYEVGVGGQFDSTNVIERPIVTGITSLGIDHVQILGNTIEEIAWHKAGIMKSGSYTYSVWQPESAMDVLRERAKEKGSIFKAIPHAECLKNVRVVPDEDFQKRNASLAIFLTAHVLARLYLSGTTEHDREKIKADADDILSLEQPLPELFGAGLTDTVVRGRCEIIDKAYGRWFLDGAHTKESLEVVSDWFGKIVQTSADQEGVDALCILLFNQQASTRERKRLITTVQERLRQKWNIRPQESIFCTNITFKSQGYATDLDDRNSDHAIVSSLTVQHEYAKYWQLHDPEASTHVVASIEEAIATICDLNKANTGRPVYILATGSFRLIGGVLTILESE
ncbi:putative folylpolyglutamate synthase [Pseudovirgaria hyperparasitica]|uniref:Folylpolyglutamate synthase n=1 Tax=Pseudovirgaria hyperparasitica TaxID=470096 RepID=A0A6A6VV54_9PEZI|nr:putative folylpolyglutamate synthase [Pseudovirgaria hyperparasitica]KAF2753147.1 putative folylpolyglutamate synthase [Pseudovirgaria hyperparasitica]